MDSVMKHRWKGGALAEAVAVHPSHTEAIVTVRDGEFIGFCELLWESLKKK